MWRRATLPACRDPTPTGGTAAISRMEYRIATGRTGPDGSSGSVSIRGIQCDNERQAILLQCRQVPEPTIRKGACIYRARSDGAHLRRAGAPLHPPAHRRGAAPAAEDEPGSLIRGIHHPEDIVMAGERPRPSGIRTVRERRHRAGNARKPGLHETACATASRRYERSRFHDAPFSSSSAGNASSGLVDSWRICSGSSMSSSSSGRSSSAFPAARALRGDAAPGLYAERVEA